MDAQKSDLEAVAWYDHAGGQRSAEVVPYCSNTRVVILQLRPVLYVWSHDLEKSQVYEMMSDLRNSV